jgi:hypothetical protein
VISIAFVIVAGRQLAQSYTGSYSFASSIFAKMYPFVAAFLLSSALLSHAQDENCTTLYARATKINNCLTNAKVPQALPGSDTYEFETDPYNVRVPYSPAAVALPTTVAQVQAAVKCAASNNVRVSSKSGGHSYASFGLGGEDGHLIVDFHNMTTVSVDPDTNIATLQPGCRLGNVAQALYKQGKRAMSHGTCPP